MNKMKLALLGGLASYTGAVMAAVPAEVTTAVKDLEDGATDVVKAVMPTVVTVLIALFGIVALWFVYKQIKKGLGR